MDLNNKKIDDFLSNFSDREEQKNRVQEEAKIKREAEIQKDEKFKADFQQLFKKQFKPKMDEIKDKMNKLNFDFEYDKEIRQNQSNQICFGIKIKKDNFPNLEINVIGNIITKKITFSPKSSKTQEQFGFKNYDLSVDEFNHIADLFELTLVEILETQYK